jgi:hypothetical protein
VTPVLSQVPHQSLNLTIVEIAFNALGPDGRPLAATMLLEVRNSAFKQVFRDARHPENCGNSTSWSWRGCCAPLSPTPW